MASKTPRSPDYKVVYEDISDAEEGDDPSENVLRPRFFFPPAATVSDVIAAPLSSSTVVSGVVTTPHNVNRAPSSSVATSTRANPTSAASAVSRMTISTVANSNVVTAAPATAAASVQNLFHCQPSTSRGLPSFATGSKGPNNHEYKVMPLSSSTVVSGVVSAPLVTLFKDEDVDLSAGRSKTKRSKKHHDSVGIPQFAESNNSQPNVSDVAVAGGDKASMASTAPKSANSSIASNNLQNNEDSQKHDDVSNEPEREQTEEGNGQNENIVLPSISSSTVAAVSEVNAAPLSSSADVSGVVTAPLVTLFNASENPPVTLSTTPHFHAKWACPQCLMQFAKPIELQAHLSIHIPKLEKCSFCVKLCDYLKIHMETHNDNRAPSSNVATSTRANPTLTASAVPKMTISTVANSNVVTAMATAAPVAVAAPVQNFVDCQPSTSRRLPSFVSEQTLANHHENHINAMRTNVSSVTSGSTFVRAPTCALSTFTTTHWRKSALQTALAAPVMALNPATGHEMQMPKQTLTSLTPGMCRVAQQQPNSNQQQPSLTNNPLSGIPPILPNQVQTQLQQQPRRSVIVFQGKPVDQQSNPLIAEQQQQQQQQQATLQTPLARLSSQMKSHQLQAQQSQQSHQQSNQADHQLRQQQFVAQQQQMVLQQQQMVSQQQQQRFIFRRQISMTNQQRIQFQQQQMAQQQQQMAPQQRQQQFIARHSIPMIFQERFQLQQQQQMQRERSQMYGTLMSTEGNMQSMRPRHAREQQQQLRQQQQQSQLMSIQQREVRNMIANDNIHQLRMQDYVGHVCQQVRQQPMETQQMPDQQQQQQQQIRQLPDQMPHHLPWKRRYPPQ